MRHSRLAFLVCLLAALALPSWAQKGEGYGDLMTPQVRSDKLGAPEHLRSYIVDGKLRLSLRDAVVLTLENNSLVRVQETQTSSRRSLRCWARTRPLIRLSASLDNITSTISPPFAFLSSIGGNTFNFNFKNTTKNLPVQLYADFRDGHASANGTLQQYIDCHQCLAGIFQSVYSPLR